MKVLSFLFNGSVKKVLISGFISLLAALFYIFAIQAFKEILEYTLGDSSTPIAFFKMTGFIIGSAITTVLGSHYITNHFEFKISSIRIKLSEIVLKSQFDKIEKNKNAIIPRFVQ